jgi:hypothetical protein
MHLLVKVSFNLYIVNLNLNMNSRHFFICDDLRQYCSSDVNFNFVI